MKPYQHSTACAVFDEERPRACTCTPPKVCTHGILHPAECYWCTHQFKAEPLPTEGGRC